MQTGFGPFINYYLTSAAWTQVDIGIVLSIGSAVALAGQMPGGALVVLGQSGAEPNPAPKPQAQEK